jgi:hypothetical protein
MEDENKDMGKEDFSEINQKALSRFDTIYNAQWTIRQEAMESRRFCDVAGAMWEGAWGEQFANRPRFEINKIARSVARIYNEYRANRITVDFRPVNQVADNDMSDTLDGMYRNDEQESNAQEAYDTAFQEGVKGGFGAFRIRNEYEDESDEDSESQQVCFEPINDADISVFWDLDSRRYDKSDAKFCFVLTPWSNEKFADEYPDISVAGWNNPFNYKFEWVTLQAVWLAEYYVREEYETKVFMFTLPQTGDVQRIKQSDYADDKEALALAKSDLIQKGYSATGERKIEKCRVRKYILSGFGVIEDCGYIAGEHIPIIPYFGNRSVINGIERAWGQVQNGKDSQRLYNMNVSSIAETAALSQEQKPVFFPAEIAGHELLWANDNINRNPYLLRNPLVDAAGNIIYSNVPYSTQPRQIAPATAALLDISNRDIQDVTGNIDQAQDVSQNTSGVAVQAVQSRLDMGVFGYMDNMAQTMRRAGVVWLSIRRAIETLPRKVAIVGEDGAQGSTDLMQEYVDPDTGITKIKNDISSGKFKVIVDVAPSFTTRRDSTVTKIMGMMQATQDPNMQGLLFNMALQNMDGEGLDELRKYSRKQLVSSGVVTPTEEEQAALDEQAQNQPVDHQAQYLQALASKEEALANKAIVDASATQVGMIKTMSEAENVEAKTIEIMQTIDAAKLDSILMLLEKLDAGMNAGPQLQQQEQQLPQETLEVQPQQIQQGV